MTRLINRKDNNMTGLINKDNNMTAIDRPN